MFSATSIKSQGQKIYQFGSHVATIVGRHSAFNTTNMFRVVCTNGNTFYNFASIQKAQEFCRINPDKLI